MILVPDYLKDIACDETRKGTWLSFSMQCTCGNRHFIVLKNYQTKQEQELMKPYNDALHDLISGCWASTCTRDEDGTLHHWKLFTPLGLKGPKKDVFIPEPPPFAFVEVIKIACSSCGKEYLLFDNRIHGYDSLNSENQAEKLAYQPSFKEKCRVPVEVKVKIENDPTLEEFRANSGLDADEVAYSNGFGWIGIYTTNKDGKTKKIFDFETA